MKLINKVIVILGIAKYDGPFESTSFTTAKYLARENDVYYVDNPFTLKDYFLTKDESFIRRKSHFFSSDDCLINTALPRLKVLITPPVLSLNFLPEGALYRALNKINEQIIVKRIKKVVNSKKIKEIIFINSFNFHYPNVGLLMSSSLKVYHCVDPLVVEYDKKHGLISERQLVETSDLVVCTSKQLYKEKKKQNINTFFIPNAADLALSSKALDANLAINYRLKSIPKPIVGYFGNIERRVDYNLLSEVILKNKDKSFVFAGPVTESYIPKNFRNFPNVFFVGRIPY
jgi:teichuronic acid biosynthesis glycosyltransferase TuaH